MAQDGPSDEIRLKVANVPVVDDAGTTIGQHRIIGRTATADATDYFTCKAVDFTAVMAAILG